MFFGGFFLCLTFSFFSFHCLHQREVSIPTIQFWWKIREYHSRDPPRNLCKECAYSMKTISPGPHLSKYMIWQAELPSLASEERLNLGTKGTQMNVERNSKRNENKKVISEIYIRIYMFCFSFLSFFFCVHIFSIKRSWNKYHFVLSTNSLNNQFKHIKWKPTVCLKSHSKNIRKLSRERASDMAEHNWNKKGTLGWGPED